MLEIEILVQVKNSLSEARKILSGLKLEGMFEVVDTYYFDPLRKELKPGDNGRLIRSFRLRRKKDKYFLTYKVDNFDNDLWVNSDEHETEVGEYNVTKKILEHLGLQELVVVTNQKYIYEAGDYEIVLEDVKGLGIFLEVEYKKEVSDQDTSQIKANIWTFIGSLGLSIGEEMNAGKPELLLAKKILK